MASRGGIVPTIRPYTVVMLLLFIMIFLGLALYADSVDVPFSISAGTVTGASTWTSSPDGIVHTYLYGTTDGGHRFMLEIGRACGSVVGDSVSVSLNYWGTPIAIVGGAC